MNTSSSFLATYRPLIAEALAARLKDGNPKSLGEVIEYQLGATGKMLRPCLTLYWGQKIGHNPESLLPLACSLECFHAASLIKDDIQDGDRIRRGQESLWAKFGVAWALAASDRLLAEAHIALAEQVAPPAAHLRLVREVARVYLETSMGQALDLDRAFLRGRGRSPYEQLARRKTGGAFALAWTGPLILSGRSEAEIAFHRRLGEKLGLAFQIQDDLKDLQGTKDGRPAGMDLAEGKLSAPLALALEALDANDLRRQELSEIVLLPREETTAPLIARGIAILRELEVESKARAWARSLLAAIASEIEQASTALECTKAACSEFLAALAQSASAPHLVIRS